MFVNPQYLYAVISIVTTSTDKMEVATSDRMPFFGWYCQKLHDIEPHYQPSIESHSVAETSFVVKNRQQMETYSDDQSGVMVSKFSAFLDPNLPVTPSVWSLLPLYGLEQTTFPEEDSQFYHVDTETAAANAEELPMQKWSLEKLCIDKFTLAFFVSGNDIRWIQDPAHPGNFTGLLVTINDITDERKALLENACSALNQSAFLMRETPRIEEILSD